MLNHQATEAWCRQLLDEQDIAGRWRDKGIPVDYEKLTALLLDHLDPDPPERLPVMAANLAREYPLVRELSLRTDCRQDLYIYLQKVGYGKFHNLPPGLTAEDVVQETLVRILAKIDTYGYKSRFRTWCTTILVRTGFELTRREQRRLSFEGTSIDAPVGEEGLSLHEIVDGKARDPEREYMDKEFWRLVELTLARSKNRDRDREIILQRILDMSGEDIAREMGISRGTVDLVMNRFKKRLKELYKETPGVGPG